MIYGIGTDIVRIDRIARVMVRTNGRFAAKVLGVDERKEYYARAAHCATRALAFVATRFAAKEAFAKAIKLGLHQPMSWQAMQTLNAPGGQPIVVVNGPLADWLGVRGINAHVTLSDEQEYALAFVLAEQTVKVKST